MTCSTMRPHDQAQALIISLDLSPIKTKLLDAEHATGWSAQKVADVEDQYRKFLYLNYRYPERQIVPSKEVDDFWHCHILDTRKYAEDCQKIFGYFLHHFPYFGMGGDEDARRLQDAFRETNELLCQTFGEAFRSSSSDNESSSVCSKCSRIPQRLVQ